MSCGQVAPTVPLGRGSTLRQPMKVRVHCGGDGESQESLKQGNYMSSILERLLASEWGMDQRGSFEAGALVENENMVYTMLSCVPDLERFPLFLSS